MVNIFLHNHTLLCFVFLCSYHKVLIWTPSSWNLYPIKYILWLFIDTLVINNNLIGPSLVNITQTWVVIRHQYGFSAVVPHMSFPSPRNQWWSHEMLTVFSGYKLSILSCLVETLDLMTVLYIIYSWTVTSKTKCWRHRKKKKWSNKNHLANML